MKRRKTGWTALNAIVVMALLNSRDDLKAQLVRRKQGKGGYIFAVDKKMDIEMIQRHIRAFNTVLEYVGELI